MGKGRSTVRWFEACVAVAGILAFAVLYLFRDAFATAPGVLLLATLVLFSTPGLLLVRWFFGEYFSGVALLPAALVTDVGLFALSSVPMLIAESTLTAYLWVCGAIVAGRGGDGLPTRTWSRRGAKVRGLGPRGDHVGAVRPARRFDGLRR